VETRLVDVGVVVRDAHGRAVPGLKKDDFQVLDDGKPRAITSFVTSLVVDTVSLRGKAVAPENPASAAQDSSSAAAGAVAGGAATRPPRFLLLFFDDASTTSGDLMHARIAARRFVKEALNPGDRVAIETSSSSQTLEFTTDTARILDTIGRLTPHQTVPEGGLTACPRITPYQAYLIAAKFDITAQWAAIDEAYACADQDPPRHTSSPSGRNFDPTVQAVKGQADQTWERVRIVSESTLDAVGVAVEYLAKMPGRRVLVLVSSGFLAGTMEEHQEQVVDRALRGGVVINSLDAKGLYSEPPARPSGDLPTMQMARMSPTTFVFEIASLNGRLGELAEPMARFAASTGGLFFHNNNDLDLAFRQVGVEPEVTYHLGFLPQDVAADGKYHKLKVRLAPANAGVVQARPGYFAPAASAPDKKDQPDDARARLDRAVASQEIVGDFPAAVSAKVGPPVAVTANVDIAGLRFLEKDGRRMQRLTFVAALLDSEGHVVAAKEAAMELALTDATFARLSLGGLNAVLTLEAPPGAYRLREVIQEGLDGRIAATLQPLQIPAPR
jgi:VWFA-related protein